MGRSVLVVSPPFQSTRHRTQVQLVAILMIVHGTLVALMGAYHTVEGPAICVSFSAISVKRGVSGHNSNRGAFFRIPLTGKSIAMQAMNVALPARLIE
jgi:hypothetical protein